MTTLSEHHMSLSSSSAEALDRALLDWQMTCERELSELRQSPSGKLVTVTDCCGSRDVLFRPTWAPDASIDPARLALEFSIRRVSPELAHVCLRVLLDVP